MGGKTRRSGGSSEGFFFFKQFDVQETMLVESAGLVNFKV